MPRSTWPAATSSSTAGAANKLSLFEIDGVLCTLVICRDGRHPELYRMPAMAGAQILFHPSCSSDEIEAVCWKRTSGRAQQPVGPNSKIFHCVANTIGESPDGKQTSSGSSFIREPNGIPLAEAGYYQEEMITAVLDLARADRSYVRDSLRNPPFLAEHWRRMVADVEARKDVPPSSGQGTGAAAGAAAVHAPGLSTSSTRFTSARASSSVGASAARRITGSVADGRARSQRSGHVTFTPSVRSNRSPRKRFLISRSEGAMSLAEQRRRSLTMA